MYFVKRPNTLKEPKLERHLFSVLTFVLIVPSGEQLWVKTIQGYWLLSLGNLLRQKRATISLVIVITLEMLKELLAVMIRKRKMTVLLRGSREGDWDLHLSSISEFVPWCFA